MLDNTANLKMENNANASKSFDAMSDSSYVRQSQLIPEVLPFSASTLRRLVEAKKFPTPFKFTPRCMGWQVRDVRAWLSNPQGITE